MAESRLEYLFNCYVDHRCSAEEEKEFMILLGRPENEALLQTLMAGLIEDGRSEVQMSDVAAASILQDILAKDRGLVVPLKNKRTALAGWMRAAAAVVLVVAGLIYWIVNERTPRRALANISPATERQTATLPGGNHALLTLSDGSTIRLDSMQNENLLQGNARINKQQGILIYGATAVHRPATAVSYNTLSTPRGGQYQVLLPDGTRVWLNASSSLRFPTAFNGKGRTVELTGEAYFEVAKNKQKPFQVKAGGMQVQVLGTHFDVNAYTDESAVKTSLLEGSVRITKGTASRLLEAGEQGIIDRKKNNIEIKTADMDEVMAWKNGLFQFEGADITTIMRQIGRWYNVEIVYAGKPPVRKFAGKISRNAQLSEVLRILELSNVKFKTEGAKIIVQ